MYVFYPILSFYRYSSSIVWHIFNTFLIKRFNFTSLISICLEGSWLPCLPRLPACSYWLFFRESLYFGLLVNQAGRCSPGDLFVSLALGDGSNYCSSLIPVYLTQWEQWCPLFITANTDWQLNPQYWWYCLVCHWREHSGCHGKLSLGLYSRTDGNLVPALMLPYCGFVVTECSGCFFGKDAAKLQRKRIGDDKPPCTMVQYVKW